MIENILDAHKIMMSECNFIYSNGVVESHTIAGILIGEFPKLFLEMGLASNGGVNRNLLRALDISESNDDRLWHLMKEIHSIPLFCTFGLLLLSGDQFNNLTPAPDYLVPDEFLIRPSCGSFILEDPGKIVRIIEEIIATINPILEKLDQPTIEMKQSE